ncbi:ROK family protein [Paenibacillus senegalensis]|uniref:ROK family protein n=1 Tax=Paenibacillus senegalensis TaxID=1465766 RepID=UPI000288F0F6|nr:ROK family protein [Paenibacillus senegalensis]
MESIKSIAGDKARALYRLIRKQDQVSKVQLLEATGWSLSTMTRTLEEMCGQGLIIESGFGESTGGRRPILYRINPDYGYVLGLDISRKNSLLILCNMRLEKLASRRWEMDATLTPDVLVKEIAAAVHAMIEPLGLAFSSIMGMGLGAVGPLDRTTGFIYPQHFPAEGWYGVPIRELLEQELSLPVVLDNGANMAILGEYWSTMKGSAKHLLYVHAGVGLRSAVMSDGKIVYGAADLEDSLGHMVVQSDGPRLQAGGNYGSLENYATISALEHQARARLKQGRKSIYLEEIPPESVQFEQLVYALKQGDQLVRELFHQSAVYFGIGLANAINMLHPQKVILGGPLLNADPAYFQVAADVAKSKTHTASLYEVHFSLGKLGEEAIVIGAAASVLNKIAGDAL